MLRAQILFVVWWLSLFWFFTWVSCKGRVRNWFRMPCRLSEVRPAAMLTGMHAWQPRDVVAPSRDARLYVRMFMHACSTSRADAVAAALPQAHVVYVSARDRHDILTLNPFPLVYFVRSVQAALRGPRGRGHGSTIGIQRTAGGQRFLMCEGARFLVSGFAGPCMRAGCLACHAPAAVAGREKGGMELTPHEVSAARPGHPGAGQQPGAGAAEGRGYLRRHAPRS